MLSSELNFLSAGVQPAPSLNPFRQYADSSRVPIDFAAHAEPVVRPEAELPFGVKGKRQMTSHGACGSAKRTSANPLSA